MASSSVPVTQFPSTSGTNAASALPAVSQNGSNAPNTTVTSSRFKVWECFFLITKTSLLLAFFLF